MAESKLRTLRGDKSLKTVADAVGITPQALSYYENGERTPRDDVKIKLAQYYKRTVGFIFFTDCTNSK